MMTVKILRVHNRQLKVFFLTCTEFTAEPTLWKTNVDPKGLQLNEEGSGIIDKLSPKYNRRRRILHQLPENL